MEKPLGKIDISKSCRLTFESVASHPFRKRNWCKQGVCKSPKIKIQGKALLTNSLQSVLLNSKKDQWTEDPICFSKQRDIKNRTFAGKFSPGSGKDLGSLKCLLRLPTML